MSFLFYWFPVPLLWCFSVSVLVYCHWCRHDRRTAGNDYPAGNPGKEGKTFAKKNAYYLFLGDDAFSCDGLFAFHSLLYKNGAFNMKKNCLLFLLTALFGITSFVFPNQAFPNVVSGAPKEIESHKECPLCGMYPSRYPQFNCQLIFKDGTYEAFDSAAGLLVYMFFSDKIGINPKPVERIYFKHYLNGSWLEGYKSFFVIGSEIMGPMGIEFLTCRQRKCCRRT